MNNALYSKTMEKVRNIFDPRCVNNKIAIQIGIKTKLYVVKNI